MLILGVVALMVCQVSPTDATKYIWSHRVDQRVDSRIEEGYGVTQAQFAAITERITQRMIEPSMDYVPKVAVADRAKQIQTAVLELVRQDAQTANALLKERLVIQGLYDWTRTHITYNLWLSNLRNDREVRKHYWNAEELFTFRKPTAVCAGISDVMVKMAQALGMEAMKVNGFARRAFDNSKLPTDPTKVWHSWVLIRQADGFVLPSDPTNSAVGLEQARTLKGRIPQGITMPVTAFDWLMYFVVYYPTEQPYGKPITSTFEQLRLTYDEWLRVDVSGLRKTHSKYTGMTWFNSATTPDEPTEHVGGCKLMSSSTPSRHSP